MTKLAQAMQSSMQQMQPIFWNKTIDLQKTLETEPHSIDEDARNGDG